MTTLTDIQSAIHTILTTLADDSDCVIQETHDYHRPSTFAKTPATTLQYKATGLDQFSPRVRERSVEFGVRLYIRNKKPKEAETQLLSAIEDIIQAFDADPTLGGISVKTMVNQVDANYETGDQDYRLAELNIEVEIVNPC